VSIFRFFVLGVTPKIFSMARPTNTNLGFTLIEMLTVVIITGVLAAIVWPSFLKEKSFANTVPQIESIFKIVSLKARANSGNAYRITLKTIGTTPGNTQQSLKIDYVLNQGCTAPNNAAGIANWENFAWKEDPNQTLELPRGVEIPVSPSSGFFPNKGFCFSGKGEVVLAPGSAGTKTFDISSPYASTKAKKATIAISIIGDVSRKTYDSQNAEIPYGKFN
jgi:prepilin-type N-terminal cleavage/methylation domain-containing protein